MTREELIIEEKVQQLYANTPNWPQIPQDEMSQLCERLLAADTVKRITMKQVVKYGEIDKKSYKEYCSGCLFETLLSVLNNYDPSQGKFIPYFSRYFKLNLQHELLEETDDDSHGGMTTSSTFKGNRISSIMSLLEQKEMDAGHPLTAQEKQQYLKMYFNFSDHDIARILNPPIVVSHIHVSEEAGEEIDIIEKQQPAEQMTPEEMAEQVETCHEVLCVVQEILSSLIRRSDTRERYNIIATWEVLLWFDELGLNTQEMLEQLKAEHPFLHPQVTEDYLVMGSNFYTEAQQLAKRGFFPTKNKVSEYKADFETACKEHPQLHKLIQDLWSNRIHQP